MRPELVAVLVDGVRDSMERAEAVGRLVREGGAANLSRESRLLLEGEAAGAARALRQVLGVIEAFREAERIQGAKGETA